MVRGYLGAASIVALLGLTRMHGVVLSPAPPGQMMQIQTAYLSGEGMSSRWQVIASKKLVGHIPGGQAMYQWFLSVYAPPQGQVAHLAYQTPGASALLSRVRKAPNGTMIFPFQDLKIVGTAQLERPAVDDVVIAFHESGADCGAATIAILGADRHMNVAIRKQITNYCDLSAVVVKQGDLAALRLTGPYYTATSAVCCPAKKKATAVLRGRNGNWVLTPALFPAGASRLP